MLCPGGLTATPVIVPTATPGKYTVYAISWDGRLRTLDAATGEETAPAEPFLPPNGKPYGLNYLDNVLYTTTAQGCGGNPNQFYSYDLATKKVGSFNPGSGGLWPRLGPSIGKDGRVYAGSGDGDYFPEQQIFGQAIIAAKQNPATKAMEMQDWFAPKNAFWLRKRDLDMNVTGPVFEYKGREYTAQSSKECRIWLLDTSALGGEDHRTPVRPDAARLQRRGAVRVGGPLGRARDLGRQGRHALGPHALLGAQALEVQGAHRARRGGARGGGGVQARGAARAGRGSRRPGSRETW